MLTSRVEHTVLHSKQLRTFAVIMCFEIHVLMRKRIFPGRPEADARARGQRPVLPAARRDALLAERRGPGPEDPRRVPRVLEGGANFGSCQFLANFGKMLLVFGCIGTDFCKKIRVLQHNCIFQKLPDYQAEIFQISQNFQNLAKFKNFRLIIL